MSIRAFVLFITTAVVVSTAHASQSDFPYKDSETYLTLRDSLHHAFNDGDSARFFKAVKNLENYLQKQGDAHAYYTQRCNEIVFLLNQRSVGEAYQLALQLSKELTDKKLEKEMYMAVNMMGHIHNYCGNKEAAKASFEEVVRRMKAAGYYESIPPIYMNMVNLEMDRNPQEAIRMLNEALEISKEYAPERMFDIECRRTLCYYSLGDTAAFRKGYQAYQEGLAQGLSSVHGRSLEVKYLAFQGKTDEAAEKAVTDLGSYGTAAEIYSDAGRWQDAFNALSKYMEANDSVNSAVLSNSMQGLEMQLQHYEAQRVASRWWLYTMGIIIALLILTLGLLIYIVLSRRRHMKELRRAYDRTLESDKMKSAFIRNISHEIRTPLNIIGGYSQVIADPENRFGDEERKDISATVTKSTRQITTLIDEMLLLSLTDSSTEKASLNDDIHIEELIDRVILENKHGLNSSTKLVMESALPKNYTLHSNQSLLRNILNALIDNAIKNTEKGQITLRCGSIDGYLEIEVEDTGCGIPESEAEHVFERFVKLFEFKEGIGLGLTLARAVAKRLGGNVTLDTTYRHGARFVIRLPE